MRPFRSLLPPAALAAMLPLGGPACDRSEDRFIEGLDKRANALSLFALPQMPDPNVPKSIFVHSRVPKLLVATNPPGAMLRIKGGAPVQAPAELDTSIFLIRSGGDEVIFPIEVLVDGKVASITRFALRFEAANIQYKVTTSDLPDPLPSRDLWLYLSVE